MDDERLARALSALREDGLELGEQDRQVLGAAPPQARARLVNMLVRAIRARRKGRTRTVVQYHPPAPCTCTQRAQAQCTPPRGRHARDGA